MISLLGQKNARSGWYFKTDESADGGEDRG